MRNIYEIRERSSRTYHWSALVTSQILVEVPWNILGSSLFFLCWFWTVGFPNDRAGFTYFMYGVLFPIYYTTIALSVASMCPTADIAGLMFSFLFSFVLTLWVCPLTVCADTNVVRTAMVSSSLTVSSHGGGGCITSLHIHILSKRWLAKVGASSPQLHLRC